MPSKENLEITLENLIRTISNRADLIGIIDNNLD